MIERIGNYNLARVQNRANNLTFGNDTPQVQEEPKEDNTVRNSVIAAGVVVGLAIAAYCYLRRGKGAGAAVDAATDAANAGKKALDNAGKKAAPKAATSKGKKVADAAGEAVKPGAKKKAPANKSEVKPETTNKPSAKKAESDKKKPVNTEKTKKPQPKATPKVDPKMTSAEWIIANVKETCGSPIKTETIRNVNSNIKGKKVYVETYKNKHTKTTQTLTFDKKGGRLLMETHLDGKSIVYYAPNGSVQREISKISDTYTQIINHRYEHPRLGLCDVITQDLTGKSLKEAYPKFKGAKRIQAVTYDIPNRMRNAEERLFVDGKCVEIIERNPANANVISHHALNKRTGKLQFVDLKGNFVKTKPDYKGKSSVQHMY